MTVHRLSKAIFACAIAVLASNCVSANRYVQPDAEGVASLIGRSVHNAFFDWEFFAVTTVDNRFVSALFGSSAKARLALTPESHRLVVQATFNRQFTGGGPYEAFVALSFTPQIGGVYQLGGGVRDNLVDVWVEDRFTGVRVTEVFSAPYQTQPKAPVYTPIYLPPAS